MVFFNSLILKYLYQLHVDIPDVKVIIFFITKSAKLHKICRRSGRFTCQFVRNYIHSGVFLRIILTDCTHSGDFLRVMLADDCIPEVLSASLSGIVCDLYALCRQNPQIVRSP
jgi:hypothetical protein